MSTDGELKGGEEIGKVGEEESFSGDGGPESAAALAENMTMIVDEVMQRQGGLCGRERQDGAICKFKMKKIDMSTQVGSCNIPCHMDLAGGGKRLDLADYDKERAGDHDDTVNGAAEEQEYGGGVHM